jgi:pimeloyl-ACP methyl ester carboxylesterase
MRTTVNGVPLTLETASHGEGPAVLLVHGFADVGRVWDGQVRALTDAGYRAVTLDVRGHGASDKPEAVTDYDLVHQVVDLMGVLDHHGIQKAHLVGHDWGAATAWALAAVHPERVLSLTALAVGHPTAFGDACTAEADFVQLRRIWYMLLFQFRGVAEQWLSGNDFHNFRHFLATHPDLDAVVERMKEPGALTAALNVYRAVLPPEALTGSVVLPQVPVPTLGIWGAKDPFNTELGMTGSAAYVDGPWRYERLDSAGHWPHLDAPDEVNRLLLDFLAGVAVPQG